MRFVNLKDLPIYLVYYIFPFISIPFRILENRGVNYEIIWILLFLVSTLCVNRMMKKNFLIILLCLFFIVVYKYVYPFFYISGEDVYLKALIIDGKWIFYLILALLWVNNIGLPRKETLYNAGVFFSKIFIIYSMYIFSVWGYDARPGILGEANYDGLLMLLPFCFINDMGGKYKDYILFFVAIVCTGSRTGIIAVLFLVLLILKYKCPKFLIVAVPVVLSLMVFIFIFRGYSSIETIDRYAFFYQAIIFFQSSDLNTFLFGVYPGIGLDISVLNEFSWVVDVFEENNDIIGVFPFYFHATYIRMALTWGVPFLFISLLYLLVCFFSIQYLPLKLFVLIVILFSTSLSILTLTNVSFVLFLSLFIMLDIKRKNLKMIDYC